MSIPKKMEKPKYKLKTIVKYARKCFIDCDCKGCGYREYSHCQEFLTTAMLYYLEQSLSRSRKTKTP